ncbi:MAG: hypothetical protein GY940_03440 [bacterium]|nr:hypothetical protein [bacterium]
MSECSEQEIAAALGDKSPVPGEVDKEDDNKQCKYNDEVSYKPCGRPLYDQEHCIFHCRDIDRKQGEFNDKFREEFERQGKKEAFDFSGFVFPKAANLRKAVFRYSSFHGVNLQGANLEFSDLTGINLRFADLRGANLGKANLQLADLGGANLQGANLQLTKLIGANLRETKLQLVDLNQSNLSGANLQGADLRGAILMGARFKKTDLTKANLQGANLQGAGLIGTNLGGANLQSANLSLCDLEAARLQDADLRRADLRSAKLKRAGLSRSNLQGVNFTGADLSGANLGKANLQLADLSGANLQGTDLQDADLREAILIKANLIGARMKGTRFKNANLSSIWILKKNYPHIPHDLKEIYMNSWNTGSGETIVNITRVIRFPPEYLQAGISILNYFGTILRKKYPSEKVKVKVEQDDLNVTLVIESEELKLYTIKNTLTVYGHIVSGQSNIGMFLTDGIDVMDFQNKLENMVLELKQTVRVHHFRKWKSKGRIISFEKDDEIFENHKQKFSDIIKKGLCYSDRLID